MKFKRGLKRYDLLRNVIRSALSSVGNMNREKNQNRMGVADLSPGLFPRNPWVLRYAGHNARFPSGTILIRMRGAGWFEAKRERERESCLRRSTS